MKRENQSMIPIIAFIGHRKSGKTTFLTRLIPVLLQRGYRVGTVKHVSPLVELDRAGTDSDQHRQAGAKQVLIYSDREYALIGEPLFTEKIEETITRLFQGFSIVLVEGFKQSALPKIEIYRGVNKPLAETIDVIAIITDQDDFLPGNIPLFSPDQLEAIADFLAKKFLNLPPISS
ncbi:molybdopterin-guanine dinucleotide biosynthesis protein B [Candidatus Acetothermia bacterium]|jgi:molybdopterin-guanine dinucleotide biosynthesis protein B|nr:molybdopterin-guanine dinucleotide biosynthesis protein B [Candidatus Acetothermia bacterium]MCI2427380.1 molybdopterin-guanine dinucleotide biosynthesis protein B [Candidatus Acetothermia bacterium]MCI2428717.1 molybdopterin-guanine dinucleotide biosynthesis protein B [Candidatus Acetothermia bacterium]